MSLDQLRYFVAVAEEESVTGAARRLRVSQPPLTRHMRALEDELGAALFARTSKGVTLLPAGEALLAHARTILREVERTGEVIRAARDVERWTDGGGTRSHPRPHIMCGKPLRVSATR